MRRLGILTSGGDCGGLNAVLKGAAYAALANELTPTLILGGYAGLYNLPDHAAFVDLDRSRIERIDPLVAGSEAGNSRVKVSKIADPDRYERIKSGLSRLEIDGLVIAGGDDTGGVAVDLASHGVRCVHAPKTMDLDLSTYSVGGDSTVNRIARFIADLKTTGQSHGRIMVVEVFGRYAGHTALRGGLAGGADCILIPEIGVDLDLVYADARETFLRRLKESETHTATYIVVVSEYFRDERGGVFADASVKSDAFGHKKLGGSGRYLREELAARVAKDDGIRAAYRELGLFVERMNEVPEVREVVPGYLVRSGPTSALDANYGLDLGTGAVYLLLQGLSGVTVTGFKRGEIHYMRAEDAIRTRLVDERLVSLYEASGVCFGRTRSAVKPAPAVLDASPWAYL